MEFDFGKHSGLGVPIIWLIPNAGACLELAIHELQRLLPILLSVPLVRGRIVAIAAVRISGVAVAPDLAIVCATGLA